MEININKARIARQESRAIQHTLVIGDDTFTFPSEIPIAFLDELNEGRLGGGMRALLGDEQYEAFRKHGFSKEDMEHFTEQIVGQSVGESPASADSSKNGSRRSKQTSSASTR